MEDIDELFDRRRLKSVASDRMMDTDPTYTSPPTELPMPHLVRTIREVEYASRELHRDGGLTEDFAMGMWTAMAAIRYDFQINDAAYVDVDRYE